MSRTVKYLLTTVLIIAAALWVLTVYRSCQKNKTKKADTEILNNNTSGANTDTTNDDVDDLYVDDEEGEGEETTSDKGGDGIDGTGTNDEEADENEDDTTAESDSKVTSTTDVIGNGGEFLVIAGAFIAESNAKKLRRQLKRKGHDSEIRIFIGSDYHSVIAGDFTTERAAQNLANKIGGEAYVHKRRYPKKRR